MMSDPITLTSAFLLGFFSTLHCIGMCGGIIGALSLSLPEEIRNNKTRLFTFVLSYNIGRITSYRYRRSDCWRSWYRRFTVGRF